MFKTDNRFQTLVQLPSCFGLQLLYSMFEALFVMACLRFFAYVIDHTLQRDEPSMTRLAAFLNLDI